MKKLLIVAAVFASSSVLAGGKAGDHSSEQGSSQGQPFASVNERMDEMREALEQQVAELSASTRVEIDCLNDYLNGTTTATDPSACPDYSSSQIGDLKQQLDELEAQIVSMTTEFASASCPEGSTLSNLNPAKCVENSAISAAKLTSIQSISPSRTVNYKSATTAIASCPAGFQVTGCSHVASATVNVYATNRMSSANACAASAYGFPGFGSVRAVAYCGKTD